MADFEASSMLSGKELGDLGAAFITPFLIILVLLDLLMMDSIITLIYMENCDESGTNEHGAGVLSRNLFDMKSMDR
jgi:hypothetical protein